MFKIDGKFNIWRLLVAAMIAALFSAGGWALSEVRDLPKTYVNKVQYSKDIECIRNDAQAHKSELDTKIESIKTSISARQQVMENKVDSKIDGIKDELSAQQTRIENKLDQTNQFLLEYFSNHNND